MNLIHETGEFMKRTGSWIHNILQDELHVN